MYSARNITDILSDFERSHEVENWKMNGWCVWPLIRVITAVRWLYSQIEAGEVGQEADPNPQPQFMSWRSRAEQLKAFIRAGGDVIRDRTRPGSKECDVLVLAYPSRRQWVGGRWVHYICAPFAEELEKHGMRCRIWQMGPLALPSYVPEQPMADRLTAAYLWRARTGQVSRVPSSPPEWFVEFRSALLPSFPTMPEWPHFATAISQVSGMSDIMEKWIARTGARIVFHDCWYNWPSMAATLAAHRLGLKVGDIQHGIQEFTHYSYHGWKHAYDAVPDIYWVWGHRAATLHVGSPKQFTVIEGGNLWLNVWREGNEDFALRAREVVRKDIAGRRSVLLTLSHPTRSFLARALETIRTMPSDWLWFLRFHPGVSQPDRTWAIAEVKNAGLANTLVEHGTDFPLYAMLAEVDLHMTFDSTCAYEALAFGKPTVIIDPAGLRTYKGLIENGDMWYAGTPQEVRGAAERAIRDGNPDRLVRTSAEFFAPPRASALAIAAACDIVKACQLANA